MNNNSAKPSFGIGLEVPSFQTKTQQQQKLEEAWARMSKDRILVDRILAERANVSYPSDEPPSLTQTNTRSEDEKSASTTRTYGQRSSVQYNNNSSKRSANKQPSVAPGGKASKLTEFDVDGDDDDDDDALYAQYMVEQRSKKLEKKHNVYDDAGDAADAEDSTAGSSRFGDASGDVSTAYFERLTGRISSISLNNPSDASSTIFPSSMSTLTPDRSYATGPSSVCTNYSMRSTMTNNPRTNLNERYQREYNRSFTKSDFVSIEDRTNGGRNPFFTSVFVCPETGESFMSGELISSDTVLTKYRMKWYATKKNAEIAAAGRAVDNFCFRDDDNDDEDDDDGHNKFCTDETYTPDNVPSVESFLNVGGWDVRKKVNKLRRKGARR